MHEVFQLPSKPYVLAAGTLEDGVIEIGVPVILLTSAGGKFSGVVEHIEMHARPGEHTIGIAGPAAEHVTKGSVVQHSPIDYVSTGT